MFIRDITESRKQCTEQGNNAKKNTLEQQNAQIKREKRSKREVKNLVIKSMEKYIL